MLSPPPARFISSFSLIAIFLFSCLSISAHATGSWVTTYQTTGTFSWTATAFNGTKTTGTSPAMHRFKQSGAQSISIHMNISVTATLTWTDPNHSPAPTKVYINENSSVIGDIVQGDFCSGTLDNGFGDPSTNIPDPFTGLILQVYAEGSHLFQADGTSGSITRTRMLTFRKCYCKSIAEWCIIPRTRKRDAMAASV